MIVDPATNELYVADGYGNHRVIVFDAATGAYKRHWGAYGKPPTDDKITYDPTKPMPQQFNNPVHCIRMSKDGLIYVCDRGNNRIQVFQKDGTFVKEIPVLKDTIPTGTTGSVMLWPDAAQTYFLTSDDPNAHFHLVNRADGKVLASFGHMGHGAGEFTTCTTSRSIAKATSTPLRCRASACRNSGTLADCDRLRRRAGRSRPTAPESRYEQPAAPAAAGCRRRPRGTCGSGRCCSEKSRAADGRHLRGTRGLSSSPRRR